MPREKERQGFDTFTGEIRGTSAVFAVNGNPKVTFDMPVSRLAEWRKAAVKNDDLVDEIIKAEVAAGLS